MRWHGGIADLFLFVQQQYAEKGAFADLHAGLGARRLGNMLVGCWHLSPIIVAFESHDRFFESFRRVFLRVRWAWRCRHARR